jgi:ABC-type Fe3+ transport system substrate-binding protein
VDVVDNRYLRQKRGAISGGFGSISLINKAPHPSAAKVFLNWFLSREGQTSWQRNVDSNSLRVDIAKDYMSDWQSKVPEKGKEYIMTDHHQYLDMDGIKKLINEALANASRK